MAYDLVKWKDILVLPKYTDKFKASRRMFQSVIGTRASVDTGIRADALPLVGRANQLCRPSPQ
ncbi:hypothetical protein BC826DRAFT_1022954, partial [Russula brevipes]